jgi:hypothetical protein
MMNDSSKKVPWAKSKAKELLTVEIISGTVTTDSGPNDVYNSFEEYQKYPKDNFRNNMKRLVTSLEGKEDQALLTRIGSLP